MLDRSPVVCVCLTSAHRNFGMYGRDAMPAGQVTIAPRVDEDYKFDAAKVVPWAHELPLDNSNASGLRWPLVSPFMPSPLRSHPYFAEPLSEFPHFDCSVPVVYPFGCLKAPIVVPVFSTGSTSTSVPRAAISHTRALDPFVFGQYPVNSMLHRNYAYWVVRCQNYRRMWDYSRAEIWRRAKKAYPNTGTGLSRQSDMRSSQFPWGGRTNAAKPWKFIMPTAQPDMWHESNRMALCLKLLQGKLMVVDQLSLETPTVDAFERLCREMRWDVRQLGAGVLFMDGGSRLAPSREFDSNFFYGSFCNGKLKVVRPTIRAEDPYDWNGQGQPFDRQTLGPKGPKNPIPFNRFNVFDALEHHLLVVTEGAVMQLEQEMLTIKMSKLPPHIRNQVAASGALSHYVLGSCAAPLLPVQDEAAARVEEREKPQYAPYYDSPYAPWRDEPDASYEVDGDEGVIRRHTPSRPGTWKILE